MSIRFSDLVTHYTTPCSAIIRTFHDPSMKAVAQLCLALLKAGAASSMENYGVTDEIEGYRVLSDGTALANYLQHTIGSPQRLQNVLEVDRIQEAVHSRGIVIGTVPHLPKFYQIVVCTGKEAYYIREQEVLPRDAVPLQLDFYAMSKCSRID